MHLTERRSVPVAVAALFLISVGLHALVWYPYHHHDPFFSLYISDALSYDDWAQRIVQRGLFSEPVFHQPPLFPVLLATVYRLGSPLGPADRAILLQVLLNSLAVGLLVPIGRLYLKSVAAGVAAAIVALFYGGFVFYGMKLLPVPLALATQTTALVLLGLARARPHAWLAGLAGIGCGLACLARTEMLLFVPVATAALWWRPARERPLAAKRRWTSPLLLLVGAALAIAPATLHNVRRGDAVLVSAAAGENLFIGNQRGADGGHTPLHAQAGDLFSQRALAQVIAEQERGKPLRPSEISAFWRGRALREIARDPAAWAVLELRKLWRIVHPGDPTDMYSLPLERRLYLPTLYALPLSTWGLFALGFTGMLLARRRCPEAAWPLGALIAVHVAVLLLFFVSTRLRIPLLFLLTPFAGLALVEGWRSFDNPRLRWPAIAMLAFVLLTSAYWVLAARGSSREVLRLSSVLSLQSRLDESLGVIAQWTREPEPDPLALDQAGWVHSKRGDLEMARTQYLRAIEIGLPAPREAQTRSRLASLHEREGQLDEAAVQHDLAVAAAPSSAGAHFERAKFRLRRGDAPRAVADLRRAAELAPGWQEPLEMLRSLGEQEPDLIPRAKP